MAPAIRPEIRVFEDAEAMSLHAAGLFRSLSEDAIAQKGKFRAALSGGTTPLRFYSLLATEPYRTCIEWKCVDIFIGDERCVPPDHRDSNFGAISEVLLSHVPANVHRIEGAMAPRDAAISYEGELRRVFGTGKGIPVFDLMLLGLGEDGHTASIFPGTDTAVKTERLAVEVHPECIRRPRVTLTIPVINSARKVVFLVTGRGKASIIKEVIEGKEGYPASLVAPTTGRAIWLLDRAAASLL
jgi:6-phosphogluconolactonase